MRNLPRLASVQVLSFGDSRDMLEYPRREGCVTTLVERNVDVSPRGSGQILSSGQGLSSLEHKP
jgi:hypothetical protein